MSEEMVAVALPDPLLRRAAAAEPAWLAKAADEHGWTWARVAWQRAAALPDAWFDEAKADRIVALWPTVFRLTEDRFDGYPFHLTFWQEVTVRLLVGWKAPVEIIDPATQRPAHVHVRVFRRLMLWLPRKNGKSEFLATLAILFWAIEGVSGGQGYVFARDEKQGRVPFDKMKSIIARDERLSANIASFADSLWIPERRASFSLLTGRPEGKHGRSPTVSVGDEMHEWKTLDLATFIRQGMGARLQPIELFASTAGLKSARVGYDLFDESTKIIEGPIAPPGEDGEDEGHGLYDPSTLVVMFAAGEDDDWRDEAVWRRTNPNLGLSPTIDFLRREAKLAKANPRAESQFRRYHLNQWVEAVSRWIPTKKWDACASDPPGWRRYPEELKGQRCYGGFDISSTRDVTALVWWFVPTKEVPRVRLLARFWVPQANIEHRSKVDRTDYDRYVAAGAMETTPGDYVDQSYVQAAIAEGFRQFEVVKVGFDPWNATKLYTDLVNEGMDGERFVEVRQGIPSLGESTKNFERLVYAGQLDHGGHPVLRWMLGNTLVRFDRNMNFAPDKEHSREKIDGIVASIIAGAVALMDTNEAPLDVGAMIV